MKRIHSVFEAFLRKHMRSLLPPRLLLTMHVHTQDHQNGNCFAEHNSKQHSSQHLSIQLYATVSEHTVPTAYCLHATQLPALISASPVTEK